MRALNSDGVEPKDVHEGSRVTELISISEIEESFLFLDEKMHEQDHGDHDLRTQFKKARILLMLLQGVLETCPELECPQKWIDEINGEWYLYLLRCDDGSHYVGISKNVEGRLETHNSGKASRYTRGRLPVELIATKGPYTESSARKREIRVKRYSPDKKVVFFGLDPRKEFAKSLAVGDQ